MPCYIVLWSRIPGYRAGDLIYIPGNRRPRILRAERTVRGPDGLPRQEPGMVAYRLYYSDPTRLIWGLLRLLVRSEALAGELGLEPGAIVEAVKRALESIVSGEGLYSCRPRRH